MKTNGEAADPGTDEGSEEEEIDHNGASSKPEQRTPGCASGRSSGSSAGNATDAPPDPAWAVMHGDVPPIMAGVGVGWEIVGVSVGSFELLKRKRRQQISPTWPRRNIRHAPTRRRRRPEVRRRSTIGVKSRPTGGSRSTFGVKSRCDAGARAAGRASGRYVAACTRKCDRRAFSLLLRESQLGPQTVRRGGTRTLANAPEKPAARSTEGRPSATI